METPRTSFRMPAEWEEHRATWIAWPAEPSDFPGKLEVVQWVYVEIVKHLSRSEHVEILCANPECREKAARYLTISGVKENYTIHLFNYDRSWLRDSAPTAVWNRANSSDITQTLNWVQWTFNAWAKYSNYSSDQKIPQFIAEKSQLKLAHANRHDNGEGLVLEGGAIDVDGIGTLLTTEQCLLDEEVQVRNPGYSKKDYEDAFSKYLGIKKTIWLAGSCEGDDTHGHIDDVARFVAPGVVTLSYTEDPSSPEYDMAKENLRRLNESSDAAGRKLKVIKLPVPQHLEFDGYPLPASYSNFYIGNKVVLVPTFNDVSDRIALTTIADLFPSREVVGIHSVDLVLGFGTLHCLSQQEPKITTSS